MVILKFDKYSFVRNKMYRKVLVMNLNIKKLSNSKLNLIVFR